MLIGEDDKHRGIIFYGESGSGKSKLADFKREIFDCHYENETRSIFSETITPESANK